MDGGREDRPGRRTRTRVRFSSKPTVTYPLYLYDQGDSQLVGLEYFSSHVMQDAVPPRQRL